MIQAAILRTSITPSAFLGYFLGTRPGVQYTGVLWFLQTLLGLYILYQFNKSMFDGDKEIKRIATAIVALTAIAAAIIDQVAPVFVTLLSENWQAALQDIGSRFAGINPFANVNAILFFVTGCLIRRQEMKPVQFSKINWICIGFIAYVFVLAWGYIASVITCRFMGSGLLCTALGGPLVVVGWYAFTTGSAANIRVCWIKKCVASLGSVTMGIYLLHVPVLIALRKLWTPGPFGERLCFTVIVLLLSWGLSLIIRKAPMINRLIQI